MQHLVEIAHVEPFAAAGASHEIISLGLSDAVRVDTGVARDHGKRLALRKINKTPVN
jgi:hypothetical protein